MNLLCRRQVLMAAGAMILAPAVSLAQQPQAIRKIGLLAAFPNADPGREVMQKALRQELSLLGYQDGKNIDIQWRLATTSTDELPRLAKELVDKKVELILAINNDAIAAAGRATRDIPIVMWFATHPVENGWVKSFARPGGNITGSVSADPEQASKAFELIRESAPRAVNIAVTFNPTYPYAQAWLDGYNRAAGILGMKLHYFAITRREDIAPVLDRIAAIRPDALFVSAEGVQIASASDFVNFAIKQKLLIVSNTDSMVIRGAMLSLSPDRTEIRRRVASCVDRILRGAKPADLPVEMPAKFELVVNMKTARSMGYSIPKSLLARADRIIE